MVSQEGATWLIQGCMPDHGVGSFGRRHRLSGQHALVAFQLFHAQQAQIGRDDVAKADDDDVTRNKLCDRHAHRSSISPNFRFVPYLRAQSLHRSFGPIFVEESQANAQSNDHRDDDGVRSASGQSRNQCGDEQKHENGIAHLAPQNGAGTNLVSPESVRPDECRPPGHFLRCQPFEASAQGDENVRWR